MVANVYPLSCEGAQTMLHLALDGEIALEDQSILNEHVAQCPACQNAKALYAKTKERLAKSAQQNDVAPAHLFDNIRKQTRDAQARRWPYVVALAALVCALMPLVYWQTQKIDSPKQDVALLQDALRTHRLDLPVDVSSKNHQHVSRFLRKRIGSDVQVPQLQHVGLDLRGGRVISLSQKPSAHLVYRRATGDVVSILATPDPDGSLARAFNAPLAKTLLEHKVDDTSITLVRQNMMIYSVIGHMKKDEQKAIHDALDL